MDLNYLYTSLDGRIGRKSYWIGILGIVIIGLIAGLIISLIAGVSTGLGLVLVLIVEVALMYPAYCLMGKRFQDRDKPASYALIGLGVSIVVALLSAFGLTHDALGHLTVIGWIFSIIQLVLGIWFLIELGILRGTVGPNQYGPDPVEGR